MTINAERVWQRIEAMARITEPQRPWTRRSFSQLYLQGRAWLTEQFKQASLDVSIDAGGNLIGRAAGLSSALRPIVLGSHSDTVPAGGRFDGILGVIAGLEVAQTLRECGHALEHPLEVVDFLAEEPSEYGVSCIGSRAIAGVLDERLLSNRAPDGEFLREGIARVGGRPQDLARPLRRPGDTAAFVELHIEQGPVLESRNIPIGVVTDIAGIHRAKIVVTGQTGHAGTIPMALRSDALVGAAQVIDAVYRKASAQASGENSIVATIGKMSIEPNAINAVPGRVEMILEVRSTSERLLVQFVDELVEEVQAQLAILRLGFNVTHISGGAPTPCASLVQSAIEAASASLGLSTMRMPSGAGHDSVFMASTGPMGMIFVPCRGGHSHCPEEWVEPARVADGTRVLYETVIRLDRKLIPH